MSSIELAGDKGESCTTGHTTVWSGGPALSGLGKTSVAEEDVLYLGTVRRLMVKHFDQEQLETLAFDLGIPWGELPGDGLAAKSRSLVTCLAERGRVDQLVEILAEERPLVDWPVVPDSRQQMMGVAYLAPAIPEASAARVEGHGSASNSDRSSTPRDYDLPNLRSRLLSSLMTGAGVGFVAGVAFALVTFIVAGILKDAITYHTGVWPDWFPGQIPDFILSEWWFIIIVVSFTAVGAIVGSRGPRRVELL